MKRWWLRVRWYLYALRLADAERLGHVYWHNHYGPHWDNTDPVYRFNGSRRHS